MANMHILAQNRNSVFAVVMHIAIPNGNNSAGMAWRAIMAREYGTTVLPDGDGTDGTISTAEKSQIVAGELVELVVTEKGLTIANAPAVFSRRSSETLADLQFRYAQYGRTI